MAKTNVLQLGQDWWEVERQPVKGKGRVQLHTVTKRRPLRDTRFLTVKEVAAMLRRSYHTVYDWCKNSQIECQPLARGYLIPEHAVEDYLARMRLERGQG